MELSLLSMLPWAIFFTTLSLSFLLYKLTIVSRGTHKNLPSGNTGLPFIGESLEFLSNGRKGHPEKFFSERMAKFSSKVFRTSLFGETAAVFCGSAGNKFLFSNENKLVTAWWPSSVDKIFPSTQQTSSQEESKKMRKLLPGFLKPEALQRYISIMDVMAQRHFNSSWANKEEVTVFPLAKIFTFWLACRLFLSVEDPDHVEKLAEPFNELVAGIIALPINLPGTAFNKGIKASKEIRKQLHAIIKKRKMDLAENKSSTTQDILSHMLLTCDENGEHMNENGIADKIIALLVGGHDTTSATITFIVKYLAELPHVYNEVFKGKSPITLYFPTVNNLIFLFIFFV